MSHPKQLIDRIAAVVATEYPQSAGYEYVFEKAIKDTRMMPDILVTQSGRYICAVEIGYTRPEKLTAYRQVLKIPDVRWYDKQGNLHADVTEKLVHVNVQVQIKAEPTRDVSVYSVFDQLPCVDCEGLDYRRVPDRCEARFDRMFGNGSALERSDEIDDLECRDVITAVITDHIKIWLPSYCDKCGHSWFADAEDEGLCLAQAFEGTPRELGRLWGGRTLMPWDEARAQVLEAFGLALDYLDGQAVIEGADVRHEIETKVHAEMDRARTIDALAGKVEVL